MVVKVGETAPRGYVRKRERLRNTVLVTIAPSVALFGPIISRFGVGKRQGADALDVFDAVFDRHDQAQWRSVIERERFAIHLGAENGLRMERDFPFDADVISVIGRRKPTYSGKSSG
jgi:hypothetical protein